MQVPIKTEREVQVEPDMDKASKFKNKQERLSETIKGEILTGEEAVKWASTPVIMDRSIVHKERKIK